MIDYNTDSFSWDCNPPESFIIGDNQDRWPSTLYTKFNLIDAMLHQARMVRNQTIIVPEKFRYIIESIDVYDITDQTMCGRYKIEFIDTDNDYIDVQGVPIKIKNYPIEKQEKQMKNLTQQVGRIKLCPWLFESPARIQAFYKFFYPFRIDALIDGYQTYWCYSDYFREIEEDDPVPEYELGFTHAKGTTLITAITEK